MGGFIALQSHKNCLTEILYICMQKINSAKPHSLAPHTHTCITVHC